MRLQRLRPTHSRSSRRPHADAAPPAPAPVQRADPAPAPAAAPTADRALAAERRLRGAGGPEDHATYDCRCGAVFTTSPTTSVSCPLCGVHQAW